MASEPFPPVEDSISRLHQVGWSVGDTAFPDDGGGQTWVVTGHRGDDKIQAEGSNEREAWWAATVAAGVNLPTA